MHRYVSRIFKIESCGLLIIDADVRSNSSQLWGLQTCEDLEDATRTIEILSIGDFPLRAYHMRSRVYNKIGLTDTPVLPCMNI